MSIRESPTPPGETRNGLDWRIVALTLGSFLALSYSLCLLGDLVLGHTMWRAWAIFLPGFDALNWANFFAGLLASFVYGVYAALVFVPLYNFFIRRLGNRNETA